MSISAFFDGMTFDHETRRIMGLAFEMARAALRVTDQSAFAGTIRGVSIDIPIMSRSVIFPQQL